MRWFSSRNRSFVTWVAPAVMGGGNRESCNDSLGSPIGTHVQLDPELDCATLPKIKADGVTLCRLQPRETEISVAPTLNLKTNLPSTRATRVGALRAQHDHNVTTFN
jgi:hypothetical protein